MDIPCGYNVRPENHHILDDALVDAAEITFERADDPLRIEPYVDPMQFRYVGVHALKLSPCSLERPPLEYLAALKEIAVENGAQGISDHLGFTRSADAGHSLEHFVPCPYSDASLDATCRNVEFIQGYFGEIPFYIENIAYLLRFEETQSEAAFIRRLLERTGCGLLLDIANILANSINHSYDAQDFIEEVLASAPRVEIHLAGGVYDEESQLYIDSHSEPVPPAVWDLLRFALSCGGERIQAVFIERDNNFPADEGWLEDVRKAKAICRDIGSMQHA